MGNQQAYGETLLLWSSSLDAHEMNSEHIREENNLFAGVSVDIKYTVDVEACRIG